VFDSSVGRETNACITLWRGWLARVCIPSLVDNEDRETTEISLETGGEFESLLDNMADLGCWVLSLTVANQKQYWKTRKVHAFTIALVLSDHLLQKAFASRFHKLFHEQM
jgi:hypothetical protein